MSLQLIGRNNGRVVAVQTKRGFVLLPAAIPSSDRNKFCFSSTRDFSRRRGPRPPFQVSLSQRSVVLAFRRAISAEGNIG